MTETMRIVRLFFPYGSASEAIWFDFIGMLVLGCFVDFRKPISIRNLDILMIGAWIPLGDYQLGDLSTTTILGYLPLFYFLPRLLLVAARGGSGACVVNYGLDLLRILTALALMYGTFLTLVSPFPYSEYLGNRHMGQSDSAVGGMAGAQALLRGTIPYGNLPMGRDCYGPAYYYSFVPFMPFQLKLFLPAHDYGLPARLVTLVANLLSTAAMLRLGTRLGGLLFGRALAFVWASLPYTLSSAFWSQTGHLLPGALMIFAMLGFHCSPRLGAVALGWASAAALFPAAFIPVWAASLAGRRRREFLVLVLSVGALLTLPLLCQERGVWKFLEATILFRQLSNDGPWSIWTHYPWTKGILDFFQWSFVPFVGFAAWRAIGKGFLSVMALTGAVVVYSQLFSLHAPGRYQLWMMPFFLPVLLLGEGETKTAGKD